MRSGRPLDRRARRRCRGRAGPGRPESSGPGSGQPDRQLARVRRRSRGLASVPAGEMVELHVLDRGAGFGDEFIDREFDRFSRDAGGKGAEGTGLGLAIVAAVARLTAAAPARATRPVAAPMCGWRSPGLSPAIAAGSRRRGRSRSSPPRRAGRSSPAGSARRRRPRWSGSRTPCPTPPRSAGNARAPRPADA